MLYAIAMVQIITISWCCYFELTTSEHVTNQHLASVCLQTLTAFFSKWKKWNLSVYCTKLFSCRMHRKGDMQNTLWCTDIFGLEVGLQPRAKTIVVCFRLMHGAIS